MAKLRQPSNRGFTLVEVVVGTVVIGIMIIAIANIFIAITAIQRQTQHLATASRLAEQKIESLRNNHYNSLAVGTIDFTSELPAELATPHSAQVVVSQPQGGIKQLDVTISYREASRTKTVKLTALLGNIGIGQ